MQTSWTKNSVSLTYRWACLLEQQTSITVYRLPTKENKLLFPVSICRKQTEVYCFRFPYIHVHTVHIYIHIYKYINVHTHIHIHIQYTHIHIYIYTYHIYTHIYVCICAAVSNGKRKPRRFSFIRLPFAHRANGSLSFIRLLAKNQTEDVCLTMG
jgi:hypothetical protein